jgi:hypothetical protein
MAKAKKKQSTVSIQITDPNLANADTPPDMSIISNALDKVKAEEKIIEKCILISRENFPITIKYGDDLLLVPPRGKLPLDYTRLDASKLPQGIVVKKLK